ncbi:hypothetical protein [Allorhodopirellula heiligendammensis]|nr:hypothetical protein [Allorhodopirellula heiligendammensis]
MTPDKDYSDAKPDASPCDAAYHGGKGWIVSWAGNHESLSELVVL